MIIQCALIYIVIILLFMHIFNKFRHGKLCILNFLQLFTTNHLLFLLFKIKDKEKMTISLSICYNLSNILLYFFKYIVQFLVQSYFFPSSLLKEWWCLPLVLFHINFSIFNWNSIFPKQPYLFIFTTKCKCL